MAYDIGSGIWKSVFAVPSEIIDSHIKMASGLSVKVLMLILRRGGNIQLNEIAELLGQSESDIKDSIHFWEEAGVMNCSSGQNSVYIQEAPAKNLSGTDIQYQEHQIETPKPASQDAPNVDTRKIATLSSGRRRFSTHEINEMAEQDNIISFLLQEAQAVIGKPLTPIATDTVVALYSFYEMQPDIILMIIQYCVSIDKPSMRYIEKVAADWLDKGIDTHEKAEAEILERARKSSIEGEVKRAFGIDRALVPSEQKFIETWTEKYKQDISLIRLAYERNIDIKAQLSFAYINGILTNWYSSGISTPAEALKEMHDKKSKVADKDKDSSYAIDELEDMVNYGNLV